ncbi:MAG TPA: nucleotidyltransferase family protein [Burkholderiales bacterium]|nr:nucleotidyltransferase family protein [Burkholderiales bacterium]
MNIVGLLLAAGAAKRFGSDKLQHRLPHGVPIAVQSLRHLRSQVEKTFVVVRPGGEKLFETENAEVVVCPNADEGMGTSLACAARAAANLAPRADGYLVALADMPFIRPSSIAAVRDALAGGAPLVAPYFRTRRGHPVGISGRFHPHLLALQGDEGAKSLLGQHEKSLVRIPVGDPGVVRDVDRPEDLLPPLAV